MISNTSALRSFLNTRLRLWLAVLAGITLYPSAILGQDPFTVTGQNGNVIFKVQSTGVTGAGSLNATGSVTTAQLSPPSAPTVTPTMGSSSTWSYVICANDAGVGLFAVLPELQRWGRVH